MLEKTLRHTLTNGRPLKGTKTPHTSIYPKMEYVTGLPNVYSIEKELIRNGYCLFRNTGIKTLDDLNNYKMCEKIFSCYLKESKKINYNNNMSYLLMNYQHGTDDRTKLSSNVMDVSSGAPMSNYICHHTELSYTDELPRLITFICLETDKFTQGYTPISNCIDVAKNLDINIKNKLLKYGLKYIRNLPKNKQSYGKTWQKTFNTENKEEVEKMCYDFGYQYEWRKSGDLRIEYTRSAFIDCADRGIEDLSFSNSILGMHGSCIDGVKEWENIPYNDRPYNSMYGNGDEFTKEEIKYFNDIHKEYELLFKWNVGDVLIVDNLNWSHARYPYTGKRKIVAMMGLPFIRSELENNLEKKQCLKECISPHCDYPLNIKPIVYDTFNDIYNYKNDQFIDGDDYHEKFYKNEKNIQDIIENSKKSVQSSC